jgi:hypothetical protein
MIRYRLECNAPAGSVSLRAIWSIHDVVTLDIVVGDDSPFALLAARPALEPDAAPLAEVRVDTSFKLTVASARAWIDDGYRRPEWFPLGVGCRLL